MRYLTILLLLITNWSHANIQEFVPAVMLESSTLDKNLGKNEAIYRFAFRGILDNKKKRKIHYSIDGREAKELLINNSYLEIKSTPGEHSFKFYYDKSHNEISTDLLPIKAQHRSTYSIQFENVEIPVLVEKPVIYLYPTKTIDATVNLEVNGNLVFTYPEYKSGWEFKAHPNGQLTFGDHNYNYLFWESDYPSFTSVSNPSLGFIVRSENVISFLENKLTRAGLTPEEQADFITYWGPRLQENPMNFVQFEFNDTCNEYAKLEIQPKPDNIFRIYMIWQAIDSIFITREQPIERVTRNGFTVIEWGGFEIPKRKNR